MSSPAPNINPGLLAALSNPASIRVELERRRLDLHDSTLESLKNDPYGFVMWAWPWGDVNSPLANQSGPDNLQKQFLLDLGEEVKRRNFNGRDPVAPIRMSISSANGTGKSTLWGWIVWWILSTRPQSVGTVTAGTFQQLEERTWSDIQYWGRMCKNSDRFRIQSSGIFSKDSMLAEKWKVTPKTARPENAHAFAGQHARTSTSFVILDEASEVADEIWKECYTCLTDGEPMIFASGQMMQNYGEFFNVVFGEAGQKRWNSRIWDGNDSAFTDKQNIKDWKEEYGDDSDYYRVHALGLPPRASALQFIPQDLVEDSRHRVHKVLDDEPLVVGYDAANGGLARHAFWFRRGLDAKTIPPIFLPGDTPRDTVVAKMADIMSERRSSHKVAALFGDQAFGAVVLQRVRELGYTNVFEVNFAESSPDPHQYNMRAYMWNAMKEWMRMGAIPDDEKLCQPFLGPGFHHRNGKLVLESKEDMAKRRVRSPDGPDSLALTFARRVAPVQKPTPIKPPSQHGGSMGWVR